MPTLGRRKERDSIGAANVVDSNGLMASALPSDKRMANVSDTRADSAPSNSTVGKAEVVNLIDDCNEGELEDHTSITPIDNSGLQPLPDYRALTEGYPLGCPVWYNFRRSSDGKITFGTGIIRGVSVDCKGTVLTPVFQVRHTDSINQEAVHAEPEHVRKEWIAYGHGCPVRVKMGQVYVDGKVVCAKPWFHDDGNLKSIKYSAVLFETKTKRTLEDNIPAQRVEYRQVVIGSALDMPATTNAGTDSTVAEVEAITGSKDAEKTSQAVPSAQAQPARQKSPEYFNKQVGQPTSLTQQEPLISNDATGEANSFKVDKNLGKRQAASSKTCRASLLAAGTTSVNAKKCHNNQAMTTATSKKRKSLSESISSSPRKKNTRPRCSVNGCNNNTAGGGKCTKHGGKQIHKKCSVAGCDNKYKNNGVCTRHGAIVDRCRVDGCDSKVNKGGVCKTCSVEGCDNQAQIRGDLPVKNGEDASSLATKGQEAPIKSEDDTFDLSWMFKKIGD